MLRTKTKTDPDPIDIQRILLSMLQQQPTGTDLVPMTDTAIAVRQNQALEHRAPLVVAEAREVGAEIEYLGAHPLFSRPRLYDGVDTDWILGPAMRGEDLVVPKREQQALRRLTDNDIEFPLLYIAHEVEQHKTAEIPRSADTSHTDLPAEQAAELVGPVPDPIDSTTVGDRLGRRTGTILAGMRRTAVIGGTTVAGIAAAPLLVAGATVAAISQLDPIVLGVLPTGEPRVGQPAAWFVLARWDW